MKKLRQYGFIALATFLSSSALGATPGDIRRSIEPSTSYERTLTGDFDWDGNPDVLYQSNGVWGVVIGMGLYEARMGSIASPIDCDVLRHDHGDRWLTLGPSGLSERRMEYVTPSNVWVWTSYSAGSANWAGASRVRVWSDDGLENFVVGLNSNASSILVEKCDIDADGAPVVWSDFDSVAISQTEAVVDVELFDLDGDGQPELAVRRSMRTDIYDIDSGVRVAFMPEGSGWSAKCMTKLRHAGDTRQWIALVSNSTTPGQQRFATIGADGVGNVRMIAGAAIHEITAADVKLHTGLDVPPGLDDVIFSSTDNYHLTVVTNSGGFREFNEDGGPVFAAVDTSIISFPDAPSLYVVPNLATPWAADVDLDGDIDVGIPVRGASFMWAVPMEHESVVIQQAPTLVVYPVFSEEPSLLNLGAWVEGSSKKLEFDVLVPGPVDGGWWDNTKFFLEMTLWSQVSPSDPMESTPFGLMRLTLPATAEGAAVISAPAAIPVVPGSPVMCGSGAPCEVYPAGLGFDRIVYMRVQVVRLRGSAYSAVTPGTMYMLHAQEPWVDYSAELQQCVNGDFVEETLDAMEEGSVRFMVAVPTAFASSQTGQGPPALGKRVGLGGHVPTITAPIDESPVGQPN